MTKGIGERGTGNLSCGYTSLWNLDHHPCAREIVSFGTFGDPRRRSHRRFNSKQRLKTTEEAETEYK